VTDWADDNDNDNNDDDNYDDVVGDGMTKKEKET
jgi:hypothetical protein